MTDNKFKKILVVDDDESLRRVIEYNISEEGYDVIACDNGLNALEIFKKEEIDLVITDLKMPDMDGIELIKHIRAISPNALVIVITAFGTVDTAVESMKLGAFEYIPSRSIEKSLRSSSKKLLKLAILWWKTAISKRWSEINIALTT